MKLDWDEKYDLVRKLLGYPGFDLESYCGQKIISYCSLSEWRIKLIKSSPGCKSKAIQFKVPTYEKYYPEKLVATEWAWFAPSEFTKVKEYYTTEIDWEDFLDSFEENLKKLMAVDIKPEPKERYYMQTDGAGLAWVTKNPVAHLYDGDGNYTLPCSCGEEAFHSIHKRNGGVICDNNNGPCACGAWHKIEEQIL